MRLVIIRAETIECTQNAEGVIKGSRLRLQVQHSLTARLFYCLLLCVKETAMALPPSPSKMCFCIMFMFGENVNRNVLCPVAGYSYLTLSIVGLKSTRVFLDHTRTKETHEV